MWFFIERIWQKSRFGRVMNANQMMLAVLAATCLVARADIKGYPDDPKLPAGQAGALYGQLPPLVNATAPQGEWQSYDLAFEPPMYENGKVTQPAKLTLFHNGVILQNGESYLGPTEHRKLTTYPATHPATAPLRLQFHGGPIEYRNMWARPLGKRD
jgi:hypothetical protein